MEQKSNNLKHNGSFQSVDFLIIKLVFFKFLGGFFKQSSILVLFILFLFIKEKQNHCKNNNQLLIDQRKTVRKFFNELKRLGSKSQSLAASQIFGKLGQHLQHFQDFLLGHMKQVKYSKSNFNSISSIFFFKNSIKISSNKLSHEVPGLLQQCTLNDPLPCQNESNFLISCL